MYGGAGKLQPGRGGMPPQWPFSMGAKQERQNDSGATRANRSKRTPTAVGNKNEPRDLGSADISLRHCRSIP